MAVRKHSREFKISAVKLVYEQGYSFGKAAKSLGVDASSIRGWAKIFAAETGVSPSGDGAVAAEMRRLRAENARLTIERDILKKAAAFFAKDHL